MEVEIVLESKLNGVRLDRKVIEVNKPDSVATDKLITEVIEGWFLRVGDSIYIREVKS